MKVTDLEVSRTEATKGLESVVTVPDDDLGRQHREGWAFVLGAIADRFGAVRAS